METIHKKNKDDIDTAKMMRNIIDYQYEETSFFQSQMFIAFTIFYFIPMLLVISRIADIYGSEFKTACIVLSMF